MYIYLHHSLNYCDYCKSKMTIILNNLDLVTCLKSVAKLYSDDKTAESHLLFNSLRRALEGPVIQ